MPMTSLLTISLLVFFFHVSKLATLAQLKAFPCVHSCLTIGQEHWQSSVGIAVHSPLTLNVI